MGASYSPAPDHVARLVQERLRDAHPEMFAVGVRVGVLMALAEDGPAVRHGGYPAAATVRVVPHKDRVTKGYDAEMVIDQDVWDGLRPRQQQALISHELAHLVLVQKVDQKTGQGKPQFDWGGRPKLRTRPGDWSAGDGFGEIVREFGEDAIEFENLKRCYHHAESHREAGEREAEDAAADKTAGK